MSYGTLISTVTVGAGGAASIDFNAIPNTFTDLAVVLNGRNSSSGNGTAIEDAYVTFNGDSANKSGKLLYGQGSGSGATGTYTNLNMWIPSSNATASTFSNISIYVPNYRAAMPKSVSMDLANENSAVFTYTMLFAGLWNSNAAITSLSLATNFATWAQYSTASLYGITKGSGGATVTP